VQAEDCSEGDRSRGPLPWPARPQSQSTECDAAGTAAMTAAMIVETGAMTAGTVARSGSHSVGG